VLVHLNFLVYILIYSPPPLIFKWEKNRKFFGGPDRYPLTPLCLSHFVALLLLRNLTFSNNKVTSHEFSNKSIRNVCKIARLQAMLQVALIRFSLENLPQGYPLLHLSSASRNNFVPNELILTKLGVVPDLPH
jgi:hypothetical protein